MKLTRLFVEFVKSEQAGGLLLIFCTLISLLLCNSVLQHDYLAIWHFPILGETSGHWINHGLMTVFFLLIGLELEREIYFGELSNLKKAMLPFVAAIGGMIVPAGLFLVFNFGIPTRSGAGIPMATDIAFAIGILSLLGSRVPLSLKVLLTALAVIDDLGAIVAIAVFYTDSLSWVNLGIAMAIFGFLLFLNRLKIHNLIPYLVGGAAMWYFMMQSGVHATITGVLLAFAVPRPTPAQQSHSDWGSSGRAFRDADEKSPSFILQHFLHKPVAFVILPLFALANTCVIISGQWHVHLAAPHSLGILAGLIIGKPLGIFLFSFTAVALGICSLPGDLNWNHVIGTGLLGGIGFTMSIFITLLAFDQPELVDQSKMAILIASVISAILGFTWLKIALRRKVLVLDH